MKPSKLTPLLAAILIAGLIAPAGAATSQARAMPGCEAQTPAEHRVYHVDYNLDGLRDLVYWNEDHFEVKLRLEHGCYDKESVSIETEIEIDSDDLASLAAPEGVRNRYFDEDPEGAMTGRVLHTLEDINGDGITDLGVFSLKGGSLGKMHSSYEVHYGAPMPNGAIEFATDIGARVDSDGIPFDIQIRDFDDDGQVDFAIMVIDPGFAKSIGMLTSSIFTDSVSLDLDLYRMSDGRYPEKPDAVRKVRTVSMGKSGEKAAVFPAISFHDVDHDGLTDLVVQDGHDGYLIYPGLRGKALFARKPHASRIAGPTEQSKE